MVSSGRQTHGEDKGKEITLDSGKTRLVWWVLKGDFQLAHDQKLPKLHCPSMATAPSASTHLEDASSETPAWGWTHQVSPADLQTRLGHHQLRAGVFGESTGKLQLLIFFSPASCLGPFLEVCFWMLPLVFASFLLFYFIFFFGVHLSMSFICYGLVLSPGKTPLPQPLAVLWLYSLPGTEKRGGEIEPPLGCAPRESLRY